VLNSVLRFTGAGTEALYRLARQRPPSEGLRNAIIEICELAKARRVRLLFDAEQNAVQPAIDAWTMHFQRRYNRSPTGRALIYGTSQAYLRSTPATLAKHLAAAESGGFTLGVKLVRGAYLGSDPRHLFWSTKEETDRAYDGIAEALIRRRYGNILGPARGQAGAAFPRVDVVLASHNLDSVTKALAWRREQPARAEERMGLVYGQLMGMADHVSCGLVQAGKVWPDDDAADVPRVYKYAVWGSVGECLKYLLRRAEENRDALARTEEGRLALRAELGRRLFRK
jgi:hypothetical protein